jgi:hypothetical protein
MMPRREFLKLIASAAAALAAPRSFAQSLRFRREIRTLSAAEVGALAAGVAAMRALPTADFRSWMYQAGVHGAPAGSEAGVADAGTYWNQCVHGGTHFLSWHRWELLFVEEIVRLMAGQCAFTLPYWDYIANGFLPDPLRTPADPSNSLYDNTRASALNAGTGALSGLNTTALSEAMFASFSSVLYGNPHSAVHGSIGGNMGSVPTAARDPVFYLHHCNIDRYWECWIRMGGRSNPGSPWTEQIFPFRTLSGRREAVVGDCGRTADLGYTYDNLPCGVRLSPEILEWLRNLRFIEVQLRPPRPLPDPWPWRDVLATAPVVVDGRPSAIVLPRRSFGDTKLKDFVARGTQVAIALEGLELTKVGREPGMFFEVWFAPGKGALRQQDRNALEQIGSFSAFDVPDRDTKGQEAHHHPSPLVFGLSKASVDALVMGTEDPLLVIVRRGLVDKAGKPLPFDSSAELLRIGAVRLEVAR